MTQIQLFPSYAAHQRQKTKAEQAAADNRNNLEIRYSEQKLRQMYAKVLAGKGNSANLRDLPSDCEPRAARAPYSEVIAAVAKVWDRFRVK